MTAEHVDSDPTPPHGTERPPLHWTENLERIADALEDIARNLNNVCGRTAVRTDQLL